MEPARSLCTILVVDDEEMVLAFCCFVLRDMGFEVLSADGGLQALPFFDTGRKHIDLALLDIMMPGFNGVELAKRIHQVSPETKIVLMSGYRPEDIKRLIGKHATEYRSMWKPFTADALAHMICNVLGTEMPTTKRAAG